MKHIQLDRGHRIEIALQHFNGLVVATHVDEQTAPGETGLILNVYSRHVIAVAIGLEQLQESLQSA